jgi:hypothetical protein
MKSNLNHLEEKLEKKVKRREKRKKPKMKVSGKTVFKLKELIRKKTRHSER